MNESKVHERRVRALRSALAIAVTVALAACGGDPNMRDDGGDGGSGGRTETGVRDTREPDDVVEVDEPTPDVIEVDEPAPDVQVEDAAPDVPVEDTAPDVVVEDTAPEASPDVLALDATPDAEPLDVAPIDAPAEAGPDVIDCIPGLTSCTASDGTRTCVDTQTDRANCGACGNACPAGQLCSSGLCIMECSAGENSCSGVCRNLQTDNANCGACGRACAAGTTCALGVCGCPMGQTRCGTACVSTEGDNANCGACGNACTGGATCSMGACVCPAGQLRCGATCVNAQSDNANCGACGTACPAGQLCSMGSCQRDCAAPTTLCGSGTAATCVNLADDETNCGMCGVRCGAGQSCVMGRCECPAGQTACGTGAAATCVNTQMDLANCGACGARCTGGPNSSTAFCTSGTCRPVCDVNFANCDGSAANGCEANTLSDSNHCGACGNQCPMPQTCQAGRCLGPPAMITVQGGSAQTARVGTAFANPLSVLVRDALGTPVPGAPVTFAAPVATGTNATGTFAPMSVMVVVNTNALGVATSPVLTAGTRVGTWSAAASVASLLPVMFSLTNTVGPASAIRAVSGGGQSATVNTAFANPLVAEVTDSFGNPVGAGTTVTFNSMPTTATPGVTFMPPSGSGATNAAGRFSVSVTANTKSGAHTVTASAAGVTGSASFALTNNPGAPVSITAVAPLARSATVGTDFAPAAVIVRDSFANPVPGVSVTYEASMAGMASVTFPTGGNLAITDATGTATRTPRANSDVGGPYEVTARLTAMTNVFTMPGFSLTNTVGAPATVVIVGGGTQSTNINTGFANPLRVSVRDMFGNPVGGVTVNFGVPTSGASAMLSSATAVTASGGTTLGEASVSATANGTVGGPYNVTASVAPGTGSLTTNFRLTNTVAAVTTLTPEVDTTPQSVAVNASPAVVLGVIARDGLGNPVANAPVTFTVMPASAMPGGYFGSPGTYSFNTTTNASGVARAPSFVANGTTGRYAVTAASGATTASFALENVVAGVSALFGAVTTTAGGSSVCPWAGQSATYAGRAEYADRSPAVGAVVRLTATRTSGDAVLSWQRNGLATLDVTLDALGRFSEVLDVMPTALGGVVELSAVVVANPSVSNGPHVLVIEGSGCDIVLPP